MAGATGATDVLSLSVHGPVGVLDLQVPAGASSADVANEYTRQTNLPEVPHLYTRLGSPLPPDEPLVDAGVVTGAVLVALPYRPDEVRRRSEGPMRRPRHRYLPGALSATWCTLAAVVAVLAGWQSSRLPDSDERTYALGVLFGTAVLAALPLGALARHRVLALPAFTGAATFAVAWDPAPERLPTVLGVAALASAVTAAVARALDQEGEEGLRVWIIGGSTVFLLTIVAALLDIDAQVVWALLLLAAMLAARFVPIVSVDVPDQYLIDLERLAVTAWSARDRPTGRRGRIVVPMAAVSTVAARGTRLVTAASAAVLAVTVVAAVMLLREVDADIDVIGARVEVGLAGASLLLAARSYRHAGARALLRLAGLACWAALLGELLLRTEGGFLPLLAALSIGLGALLVVVAVALGRGWRSAWWSRRAEIAESVCGAFAVGSVVVAAGFFRLLWELTS
ncbi:hypothetical protein GCM10023340_06080 [Nocardioides marinquilinus]|uniref:Type VII secretion integral membrane protein EccD n=1 Tax=Nocardioides marinquilinus TaxID=1210400 RepID=A0ABP9P8Y6_9ACTN